jgi:hypothetical protein
MAADFEPFLSDYAVTFHQAFTLLDSAMSTSEISPIHLSGPRNRAARSAAEKPKPEEPPANGRFLQHFARAKREPAPANGRGDAGAGRADDSWLFPAPPAAALHFLFQIESGSGPWRFSLLSDRGGEALLGAAMNGAGRKSGLRISAQKREVGEGTWDGSAFSCAVAIGTERGVACCAVYSGRLFDLIIPAIKKVDGRSRMMQITGGQEAGLAERASKGAKEAIRLKARESSDLTFGGAFERAAPGNFQLVHDSNPKKVLCALGLKSSGAYALEVAYPLSPVQGFLAGIAATMP